MYKQFLLLSAVFFFALSGIYGQTDISNDYTSPTHFEITEIPEYQWFSFDHSTGNDLSLPRCERMYPGASSYFSFEVPLTGESTVRFSFPDEGLYGIALYTLDEFGDYQELRCDVFRGQEVEFFVYAFDEIPETFVLGRFWKLGEADAGDFGIYIVSEPNFNIPKVLSVSTAMYTPQQLVQDVLISGCVEAYNVQYTGHANAIGYFWNGIPGLDFESGVIMSTGNVNDAPGPNISGSTTTSHGTPGDADLNAIIPQTTQDAAVLTFDFLPADNTVEFQYVFGSDEYPEFAPPNSSTFNDVFAFFISGGPENYTNENIALLPGTSTPVSINNVNAVTNSTYYINNANSPNVEYDGLTTTLTAFADVTICELYQMKLAIADVGDGAYDSAVFLKAGSFTSGELYEVETFNAWGADLEVMQGCSNFIVFSRTDATPLSEPVPVVISISGTAIMGTDYTTIPTNFEIPAWQQTDTIFFDALITGNTGITTIILDFENGCPCTTSSTQHIIEIHPEFEIDPIVFNSGPICAGECADLQLTLNAQDQDEVSVVWSTGHEDFYNFEVCPDVTTTYTVTITYPCDEIVLSTQVIVVQPPVVDLGPDQEIDQLYTTLNSNMDPNNTGEWTYIPGSGPGNVTIDDPDNPIINVEVDEFGYYSFVWTETSLAPNCVTSDTIIVYFYHIPTAEFSTTELLCFGDYTTVTFEGDIIESLAVLDWDFGDGVVMSGSGNGPYEILFPTSGTHTICVLVTEDPATAYHCEDVFVPPLMVGDLIVDDDPCYQSCQGGARIDVDGGTPPYTYSWASQTHQVTNLCVGDYGVVVTDANGCEITETFTITQPEELIYDTMYNHVDCYGQATGSATIIASQGTPPYTYNWDNGYIGSTQNDLYSGVYIVTVTDTNGCTAFEQFTITEPNLLLATTSSDLNICEHQTVNITVQEIGGTAPYTYYWDNGDGTGFSEGPQSFQEIPHEDVIYSVYIVDGHNCVSPTENIEIRVSPEMIIDLTTVNNTCYQSCDGRATIELTGGLQPFHYSWDSDGPNLTELCQGLYTLTITDDFGCNIDTLFIITHPTQLMMTMEVENTACHNTADGTASVVVQGGTPPYNYVWSDNTQTNTLVNGAGHYTLTVSDDNNCRIYGSANINSPQPLQMLPLYHPTICLGGETMVIAQATGGTQPYEFNWEGSDGSEYNTHQFMVSPVSNTQYYFTVTDARGCVVSGSKVNVTVSPPISIEHINITSDHICQGQGTTIELDIAGGNGGPYQITLNDGSIVTSPFTYYPDDTTNLIIRVDDLCETPSALDSIMIYVQPKPTILFTSSVVDACPGIPISFTQHDTIEGYTYVWDFGDNRFAYIQNPVHAYEEEGIYNVTLTVRDEYNCQNKLVMNNMIEIYPKPYANFMAEPEVANIINPRIKFRSLSEGEVMLYWYYGDGDSTLNFRNPEHVYKHIGEYEATLVVGNEYGCTDTAFRTILIRDKFTLYAPSAFSPNGDGKNDCFRLCGKGIDKNNFYLVVYNRWGEKVFETDKFDPDADCDACANDSWDGTSGSRIKGDPYLPSGQYYWYSTFMDYDGIGHEFSGNVTLIR
jgi:gliding motility-associated-like protein